MGIELYARASPLATSHRRGGVTFDCLCAAHGIGRIDFLKMNIEGAERRALPVCREALERARSVCTAATISAPPAARANRSTGLKGHPYDEAATGAERVRLTVLGISTVQAHKPFPDGRGSISGAAYL